MAVLRKFAALTGEEISGEKEIRGEKGSARCPPDDFVQEWHRLHGLVRGIYVPRQDPFALSILLTEKDTNFGRELAYFAPDSWRVSYKPPIDRRAAPDIVALKNCMNNRIPIGVIHNERKGVNRILGLGLVIDFDGSLFTVVPYRLSEQDIKSSESSVRLV